MRIGITGTRRGCDGEQSLQLRSAIETATVNSPTARLLHGDCIGVDAEAHKIALELGIPIEVFPPSDKAYRAYTTGWEILHRERIYAARNQLIVDGCDVLVAVPEGPESQHPRSGTWLTVRMARRVNRPIIVLKGNRW